MTINNRCHLLSMIHVMIFQLSNELWRKRNRRIRKKGFDHVLSPISCFRREARRANPPCCPFFNHLITNHYFSIDRLPDSTASSSSFDLLPISNCLRAGNELWNQIAEPNPQRAPRTLPNTSLPHSLESSLALMSTRKLSTSPSQQSSDLCSPKGRN